MRTVINALRKYFCRGETAEQANVLIIKQEDLNWELHRELSMVVDTYILRTG